MPSKVPVNIIPFSASDATEKQMRDLARREADAQEGDPDQKTQIQIAQGRLAQITEASWEEFKAANRPPTHFLFGDAIARLERDRGDLSVQLVELDHHAFRGDLAQRVRYFRYDYSSGRPTKRPMDPPVKLVRNMMSRPRSEVLLPTLHRIISAPIMSRAGRIIDRPGYDRRERVYYNPTPGLDVPPVSETPKRAEVKHARELLLEPLQDFPFEDEASRCHAVAEILLPFARELIDGPTPPHIHDKPTPGTGAGKLATVTSLIFTGRLPAMLTEAESSEEWRKRITATLLEAPSIVVLDNVQRPLVSPHLAALWTAPFWTDRVLGVSRMTGRLPVRQVWIVTGNNIKTSREIGDRSVWIRMDAGLEDPRSREDFHHPQLEQWVLENRGELIWAALTILRCWFAADQPQGNKVLGSFENWSRVMGGILEVAGVNGFLGNRERMREQMDRETHIRRTFVRAWQKKFGDRAVRASSLLGLIVGLEIPLDLGSGSQESRVTRLGFFLERLHGQRFGDVRVVRSQRKSGGSWRWRLKEVRGR